MNRLPPRLQTYWQHHDEWCCPLHGQSIKIPAGHDRCYYKDCPSRRPSTGRPEPVLSPPVVVPRRMPRPPVVAQPKPALSPPVEAPAPVSQTTPKRRGSHQVSCAFCGTILWRKPSEIKGSTVFFCDRNHQNEYRLAQERAKQTESKT